MHLYKVLKRPVTTEKTNFLSAQLSQYTFEVDGRANKQQIKEAVEKAFGVKVVSVNVSTVPGKPRRFGRYRGRKPEWKKAVVKLAPGNSIAFFEGV